MGSSMGYQVYLPSRGPCNYWRHERHGVPYISVGSCGNCRNGSNARAGYSLVRLVYCSRFTLLLYGGYLYPAVGALICLFIVIPSASGGYITEEHMTWACGKGAPHVDKTAKVTSNRIFVLIDALGFPVGGFSGGGEAGLRARVLRQGSSRSDNRGERCPGEVARTQTRGEKTISMRESPRNQGPGRQGVNIFNNGTIGTKAIVESSEVIRNGV